MQDARQLQALLNVVRTDVAFWLCCAHSFQKTRTVRTFSCSLLQPFEEWPLPAHQGTTRQAQWRPARGGRGGPRPPMPEREKEPSQQPKSDNYEPGRFKACPTKVLVMFC